MQDIYDYSDVHADETTRDLQTLVRRSSVSAQNVGLEACAKLVTTMMDETLRHLTSSGTSSTPRPSRKDLATSER